MHRVAAVDGRNDLSAQTRFRDGRGFERRERVERLFPNRLTRRDMR
jgi:hypothetical protein